MQQSLKFYLTLVFQQDEKTGEFTAFYAQFPDAISQGRTKEEATSLLNEILPYALSDKKDEFLRYHKDAVTQDQLVYA